MESAGAIINLMHSVRIIVSCLLVLTLIYATSFAADEISTGVILVWGGKPVSNIVIPDNPTTVEKYAAEKLQFYFQEITGAKVPVISETESPITGVKVTVGNVTTAAPLLTSLKQQYDSPEAFTISAADNIVTLAGNSDVGTLRAVYFLLESLGCRWYLPAPWGFVIPKSDTITIPLGEQFQTPDFKIRTGIGNSLNFDEENSDWQINEWARGNHIGGMRWWGAGHSYSYLVDFTQFEKHPEWFAYFDGARHPTQLCTTNPEVRAMALNVVNEVLAKPGAPELICISPNDMEFFCECENCQKLIPEDETGQKLTHDYTDRIVDFANFIADNIRNDYPEHYVTYYCDYHSVGTPKIVKPAKNTVFWITHWAQDQLHPTTSATRMGKALESWSQYGNPIFLYTYWGSYGSFTYWPAVKTIASDVKYFHDKGAMGLYSETHLNWGGQHLNFIIFPRMLWDSEVDANKLIAEFCDKFFGPAAQPMMEYYQTLEDTVARGPEQFHLHTQIMEVFTPQIMAHLRDCLAKAWVALDLPETDPVFKQRLSFVEAGYQIADFYYSINELKNLFSVTKDPALREEIIGNYRSIIDLINQPEYKDRLIENSLFEAGIRNELASVESGTTYGPGDFVYEDGFEQGGRSAFDTLKIDGFTNGVWGLNLPPGGSGYVLYKFSARDGVFDNAKFTRFVIINRGSLTMQVSVDGPDGPWQDVVVSQSPDASTIPPVQEPVDLSPWIKGHTDFWLQFNLTNELAKTDECALDLLRLEGNITGRN